MFQIHEVAFQLPEHVRKHIVQVLAEVILCQDPDQQEALLLDAGRLYDHLHLSEQKEQQDMIWIKLNLL